MTARRAAVDFAAWIRDLVDGPYAAYDRIQIVVDNLSTHTPAAFYEAFAPAEAPARPSQAGVPLGAEACQLAQQGRDRLVDQRLKSRPARRRGDKAP